MAARGWLIVPDRRFDEAFSHRQEASTTNSSVIEKRSPDACTRGFKEALNEGFREGANEAINKAFDKAFNEVSPNLV